jgi:transcriptional regulator with XRE-family HTH domain
VSGVGHHRPMDDRRIGSALRALRRRRGLRQVDVAAAMGLSQSTVSRIETGRLDALTVGSLRRIFKTVDAGLDLEPRWRGAALDRLLDERHAELVGGTVRRLRSLGWQCEVEVSYSLFGEQGSVDVLARHERSGSILVVEVKSQLVAAEETIRRLDVKTRLGPRIAADRYGGRPTMVGRLLILPASSAARRRIERHRDVFAVAFPDRGLGVRRWLDAPSGPMSGIAFLPEGHPVHASAPRRRSERSSSPRE